MSEATQPKITRFVEKFLLSWVEISETQTSYKVPMFVYVSLIVIYFLQTLANIVDFSEYGSIFPYVQQVFKLSTLVDLLYDSNSQSAVWALYIFLLLVVYCILGFVTYVGYLRYHNQHSLTGITNLFLFTQEVLNTIFSIYFYCIFDPIMKINIAVMVSKIIKITKISGRHSLIFETVTNGRGISTAYGVVIGVHGALLNILIQGLTTYFLRNFEYNDQNGLKRKYSILSLIQVAIKIIITVIFVMDTEIIVANLIGIIFGYLHIYDALKIRPFLNQTLAKTYISASVIYTLTLTLNILKIFDIIDVWCMAVMILWFSPLLSQLSIDYYNVHYMNAIHVLPDNLSSTYKYFTLYSEEILQLFYRSKSNEDSKMILFMLFKLHVLQCKNPDCFSFQLAFKEENNIVYNNKYLIQLANQLFQEALANQTVLSDRFEYEIISLKYISFIQKYLDNSLLSYYFLNKLANNQKYFSYYFSLLFQIYSDKLKHRLLLINIGLQNNNKMEQKINDGMKFYTEGIQQVEEFTQDFPETLVKVVNYKLQIWQATLISSNNMDDLLFRIRKRIENIMVIRSQIIDCFQQVFGPNHEIVQQFNCGYHKLQQLFQLFVMNDVVEVGRLEQKIQDLKKRDQYKEDAFLNNFNFMNGQSIIIQVGLSIDNGKILNKKNLKIPEFFGYSQQDWDRINTINDIMPAHVSIIHDQILAQYLQKGYSPLMTTARKLFIMNKNKHLFSVSLGVRNDYVSLQDCVFNVSLLRIQQNKELLMFDEMGKIIALSENLFSMLSFDNYSGENLITYEQMTSYGYIQLLSPNFLRVFNQIRQELNAAELQNDVLTLSFNNLSCNLTLSTELAQIAECYVKLVKKTQLSLLNAEESEGIQKFLQKYKQYYGNQFINQKLGIKFTLFTYYRRFDTIDERILRSITSSKQRISLVNSMRYFVLECSDVQKLRNYKHRLQTNESNHNVDQSSGKEQVPNFGGNEIEEDGFVDSNEETQQREDIEQPNLTVNNQHINLQLFEENITPDQEQVSEMKQPFTFREYGEIVQNNGQPGSHLVSPRSQLNSLSSPRQTEQLLFKSHEEIDSKKKSFLLKMLSFQRKKFDVSDEIPKVQLSDQNEIWPFSLEDMSNINGTQNKTTKMLNSKQQESGLKMIHSMHEEQEYNRSQVQESDEHHDQNNGFSLRDVDKRDKDEQSRFKREKFEQDISSQNSRSGQTLNLSVSNMFLKEQKPKQFINFQITIVALFFTITLYTLIQLILSTKGFQTILEINQQVDTAYSLQSSYTMSTSGVVFKNLNKQGVLKRNFSMPIEQETVFSAYMYNSIVKILDVIQSRFFLLRKAQDQLKSININVIEFYDQTAEHLNGLRDGSNKYYYDNIIFGIPTNYIVTNTLNRLISELLKQQQADLINNFYVVFYITLALVLGLTLYISSTYGVFLQFQEKMLLVFTRVNLGEYMNEVSKLEYGKQYLRETKGSYIVTNDFIPSYLYFKLKQIRNKEDGEIQEKRASKKLNGQSKGQILSSRIYTPQLSVRSQIFQFAIIGILIVIYLIGAIIFVVQTPAQLQYISDYYLRYSSQFQTIQQIMIYTEIKGAKPFLFKDALELGYNSFDEFETYYNSLLDTLNQFTSQDKIFTIKQAQNNQVIQLLYGDLCLKNASIPHRETLDILCKTELKVFYQNGIIGMIKSLLIMFYSYQHQIDTRHPTTDEEAMKFLGLTENWALLILFPATFGSAIDAALSKISLQLIGVTNQLGNNLLIYLSVSGVCIDIILWAYFYVLTKQLKQKTLVVQFLLTMTPWEKLSEPNIMQMIKQIQQY